MMNEDYTVGSAMHPFPHTIGLHQTLAVAKAMMREHNIRHLPVQDGGQLRGVLSERDIEFALRIDRKEPSELTVADAYTVDPYITAASTALAEVASRMAQEHIGCALITEKEKVVGIFTTVDACRVLAEVVSGCLEQ